MLPYDPDGSQLSCKHSVVLEGRLKTVSSLCLEAAKKRLLIGTEGGNIYQLQLANFQLEEEIIYQVVTTHTELVQSLRGKLHQLDVYI